MDYLTEQDRRAITNAVSFESSVLNQKFDCA